MADHDYKSEIDVPTKAIQIIDSQVAQSLPLGTQVTRITAHSSSLWTRTARIEAKSGDEAVQYFLKTSYGERGRKMVSGEFIAMTKIHAVSPNLVPKPITWGAYETLEDVHFFLCEFRNMAEQLPDIDKFPAMMAELHRKGTSPDGRFGFYTTTYHGNTPIEHGWSSSWEEYFARTTRSLLEAEKRVQGYSDEIAQLSGPFFDNVVPRLLRPLEKSIQPALIHGDLWHGNAAMDTDTGEPIIFDAASFYAHNEYELAVWRQPWNEIKEEYRVKYLEHLPPSYPERDFDDRGALYSTRVNILDSILYSKDEGYRQIFVDSMRQLVQKFAGSYTQ